MTTKIGTLLMGARRVLVNEGWIQGTLVRSPNGGSYKAPEITGVCLVGALYRAAWQAALADAGGGYKDGLLVISEDGYWKAQMEHEVLADRAREVVRGFLGREPESWNDADDRTAEEVANVLADVANLISSCERVGPASFQSIAELVASFDHEAPTEEDDQE